MAWASFAPTEMVVLVRMKLGTCVKPCNVTGSPPTISMSRAVVATLPPFAPCVQVYIASGRYEARGVESGRASTQRPVVALILFPFVRCEWRFQKPSGLDNEVGEGLAIGDGGRALKLHEISIGGFENLLGVAHLVLEFALPPLDLGLQSFDVRVIEYVKVGRVWSHLFNVSDVLGDRRRRDHIFFAEGCLDHSTVEMSLRAIALDSAGRAGKSGAGIALDGLFDRQDEIVVGAGRDRSRRVVHVLNDSVWNAGRGRLSPLLPNDPVAEAFSPTAEPPANSERFGIGWIAASKGLGLVQIDGTSTLVQATPAPEAGTGFLSFLMLGLAGLWHKRRSIIGVVRERRLVGARAN